MKREMKMPQDQDREWKVKWKCLKIEIESEKWNVNASRSRSEISQEFSRNSWGSRNNKKKQFWSKRFFYQTFTHKIQQHVIPEPICHRWFWGWSLVELLLVSLWNWADVKSNKAGSLELACQRGYICWTFLHFLFLNVSSSSLPDKIQKRTGCTCLTFLHPGFSNVFSKCLSKIMQSHIGCIC